MDKWIIFSWLAYYVASLLVIVSVWRLSRFLPMGLQLGLLLCMMGGLWLPIPLAEYPGFWAPAWLSLPLEWLLIGEVSYEWVEKALPLLLWLILAWPLGFVLAWWLKRRALSPPAEDTEPSA